MLAQDARGHLFDGTFGEFAQLERTKRHADESRHRETEMTEDVAHFAVLALADGEGEPEVRSLHAVDRRFDLPVVDAIDRDAGAQFVELFLRDRAVRAHAITPQPARGG